MRATLFCYDGLLPNFLLNIPAVLTLLVGLGVAASMLLFLNVLLCLDSGAAIEPFIVSGGVVDVFTCEVVYDICFVTLGGLTAKFCYVSRTKVVVFFVLEERALVPAAGLVT